MECVDKHSAMFSQVNREKDGAPSVNSMTEAQTHNDVTKIDSAKESDVEMPAWFHLIAAAEEEGNRPDPASN